MDLLEKFLAVEIQSADCMTEADRQFCQRQQEIYQDAAEGFYQIAVLWTDMYDNQSLRYPRRRMIGMANGNRNILCPDGGRRSRLAR